MISAEHFSEILARAENNTCTPDDVNALIETVKELDAHALYHQQGTLTIAQVTKYIVEKSTTDLLKKLSVRSQKKMTEAAEIAAEAIYQTGVTASLFLSGDPLEAIESSRVYLSGLNEIDAQKAVADLNSEEGLEYELTGNDNTGEVPAGTGRDQRAAAEAASAE